MKYIIQEDCPLGKKGEEVESVEDGGIPHKVFLITSISTFILLKLGVIAVKDETPKRWRPKIDQTYYYFDGAGMKFHTHWANDFADVARLAFGNVFRTEQEAIAKALEIKKVLLAPVINEKK